MTKSLSIGVVVAVAFLIQTFNLFALETSGGLSANDIIDKAVEQARRAEAEATQAQPEYTFTKVTETQELDTKGRVKEQKKSLYKMFFQSGLLSKKRVAAPGESAADSKKKEAQENSDPLKLAKYKSANRGDCLSILTPEFIGKYVFSLVSRTNVNGRSAFEVAFRPRQKNLPGKELAERVLNHAAGSIWIDAQEFEVAKAHVHVDSEVTVGGGLLGSLKRAVFMLERTRLPAGIWFERSTKTDYEARKLTESTRVITQTVSSNFRKLEG